MSNLAILFTFHKITPLVLRRLKRLRDMNRNDVIIPMFGVQQRLFFPGITINTREMRVLNLAALRSRTIYRTLEYINQRVESFRRQSEITSLRRLLERWGLNLYCDYTPMGWHNLDIVIIKWFSSQGKNIDFKHLIFLEHDVYLTKPVSDIYSKYTDYDAGFTHYGPASPKWKWYHSPHKAREFLINWLRERGLKTTLYGCLFVGNMVSRKVLERLERVPYPHYGYCEMRWPTIITALGFRCTNLNFPMARYRPYHKKQDILAHKEFGIFHPVLEEIDES